VRATAKQYTDHHPGTDAHPDSGSERTSRTGAAAHFGPAGTDICTRASSHFGTGAPGTERDPDIGADPWNRPGTD
jgi:hypothetical protein